MSEEKLNSKEFHEKSMKLEHEIGNLLDGLPVALCASALEIILCSLFVQLNWSKEKLTKHLEGFMDRVEEIKSDKENA